MASPYDVSDVQADDDNTNYVNPDQPEQSPEALATAYADKPSPGLSQPQGVRTTAKGQYEGRLSERDGILGQIKAASDARTSAYQQQQQAMKEATDRLMQMQMGPDVNEQIARRSAALVTPGGNAAVIGALGNANVGISQDTRNAIAQRNALFDKYNIGAAQANVGAANSNISALTQQLKIADTSAKDQGKLAEAPVKAISKYVTPDPNNPDGPGIFNQQQFDADQQIARQKQQAALALKQATMSMQAGMYTPEAIKLLAEKQNLGMTVPLRNAVGQALVANEAAAQAAASGDPAQMLLANQNRLKASQGVLKDYQSGKTYQSLQGGNTAIMHMNTFEPLIADLANGDTTAFNKVKNYWNENVMGSTAPQNFNAVKDFVAGEVSKAVLPGGGGEAERQSIANAVKSASNPQALHQVVQSWKELLAGKLKYTQQNWENSTRGPDGKLMYGDFGQFLLPETKKALGYPTQPAPAVTQPKPGWTIRQVPPATAS